MLASCSPEGIIPFFNDPLPVQTDPPLLLLSHLAHPRSSDGLTNHAAFFNTPLILAVSERGGNRTQIVKLRFPPTTSLTDSKK